ncbi:hypothetical protein DRH27_05745 [Candidatus Falkowbacteria bacterium]|nr:MAG: hypothetical protein DRH27_05745 [Candidatus Falkowbacteria bacterium]
MLYIIDANNLAGKLKMLEEKNFDKKLRDLIKEYFKKKKSLVILVFDSSDPMGDKITDGNITLVYTPKDKYYNGADDKIVEILEKELSPGYSKFSSSGDEVTVITDDREIIKRTEKIIEDIGSKRVKLERATDFAVKLRIEKNKKIEDGKRGLEKKDMEKINEELLGIWK